jgi:hypothetical protein
MSDVYDLFWKSRRSSIAVEICISVGKIVTAIDKLQVRTILAEHAVEKLNPCP